MTRQRMQLEGLWHRAIAGVLSSVVACLVPVPALAWVWVSARLGPPDWVVGLLALVALSLTVGLLWTVLLGLQDVLLGFEVRVEAGEVSWPHRLGRWRLALECIADATLGDPVQDVVLVTVDGTEHVMHGTGLLSRSDRLAAAEMIRSQLR